MTHGPQSGAARLDGRAYIEHIRASGGEVVDVGQTVVLALHPAARPRRARHSDGPFGRVDIERSGPRMATVSPKGPGPAVAAMTVEMLAGVGVTRLIGVGIAGSFSRCEAVGEPGSGSGSGSGTGFVIERAVSDESVSGRYGKHLAADPTLTAALTAGLGLRAATSYSTATPFRLDLEDVAESGAALIEMEASALFSASEALGIEAGLVVVVSDSTTPSQWSPGDPSVTATEVSRLASRCRSIAGGLS